MTKAAVQTSILRLPMVVVRPLAIATIHRLVDRVEVLAKTEAGSTSSRLDLEMIGHRPSLIARIQVHHNHPAIAAGGSASRPVPADVRTIALPVTETTVAENRSWNSTSLLSPRATRLLTGATPAGMTVATVVVWAVEIMAVDMIAATAVAA
jgi:hypothetical protein